MGLNVSAKIGDFSSPDRLVQAVLAVWETEGNGGISARALGQAAGVQVSSIYHHFGDMEHLLLAAHDHARQAAERWCAGHLDALADAGEISAEGFPALLAALMDDWSHGHRRLAFAWRECQLMAARDPRYLAALRPWQQLWPAFWEEICACCGLAGFGAITSYLFDGESLLHLTLWRRAVDRSCLDETCRGWCEWLGGRLAEEGPWRRFARNEALRSMPAPSISGPVAEQIAAAAADTVAERGVAGLTHRAVAAQTGLSLGVVSYNFRTSADLLHAAFQTIYRRVLPFPPGQYPPSSIDERNAPMIESLLRQPVSVNNLLALDELLIAVARDPGLRPLAAQLRYLRGHTSGGLLRALLEDGREVSPLDAALFSGFGTGQRRASVGMTPEEMTAFFRQSTAELLTALG